MGSQALISSHFNSDCNFTLQTLHTSVLLLCWAGFGWTEEQDCLLFVSAISNYWWSLPLPPPSPPPTPPISVINTSLLSRLSDPVWPREQNFSQDQTGDLLVC